MRARNSYADTLRKRKEIRSLDDLPEPAAAFDLKLEILGRELRTSIGAALEVLDERTRQVIAMRSQGFSFAEVAATVGITDGSARVLHHRAMKRLKEYLGKEGLI